MGYLALWNNFSSSIGDSNVKLSIFRIFSMGKLTQAQKALFLWRNPLSYSKK